MGIHEKYWLIQRDMSLAWGMSRKKPQAPYMTLGTAAMRSIIETRKLLKRTGAYSLMNRAVARATGKAMANATRAISKVPRSVAEMPILSSSGSHSARVRKLRP